MDPRAGSMLKTKSGLIWRSWPTCRRRCWLRHAVPLHDEGNRVAGVPEQVLGVHMPQVAGIVFSNLGDDVAATHLRAFLHLLEQTDSHSDTVKSGK